MAEYLPADWIPDLPPLDEGYQALEVAVCVKGLTDEGKIVHCFRYSADLTTVEAIGMHVAAQGELQRQMAQYWEGLDDG